MSSPTKELNSSKDSGQLSTSPTNTEELNTTSGRCETTSGELVPKSVDEIGRELDLSPIVIQLLKNEPKDDKDPVLILNYKQDHLNRAALHDELIANNAIPIHLDHQNRSDVYKFAYWDLLDAARDALIQTMPTFFYSPLGVGHYPNQQGVWTQMTPNQTIQTKLLSFVLMPPGPDYQVIVTPYEFFKV